MTFFVRKWINLKVNNSNNPEFLNDYLVHIKVTKLLSERTIQEYYFDIRMFLKYILLTFENSDITDISDVDISRFPQSYLKKITISDLYNFIFYVSDERENKERARYKGEREWKKYKW